ncbi:uncharacterized protein [Musca autumnalis]|uniref:uncharacterized protein n=1 Tax=Musca autumnalis TaxID=221902 RepID=UPI003CFAF263
MDKLNREKFKNCLNDLQDYVSILTIANTEDDIHRLEKSRVQLDSVFDQVKKAYVECRDYVPEEGEKAVDQNKLRTHYLEAIESYKNAAGAINGQIQTVKLKETEMKTKRETELGLKINTESDFTPASRLPPCDTDIFKGGYNSTIVLAWLKKPPCHWSTFVGNRISEIIENVGNERWRHVDSEANPADVASRGCSPSDLKTHSLWWHGPHWLKQEKTNWPSNNITTDTNLEKKTAKVLTLTTITADAMNELIKNDPLKDFSILSRAYRAYAYARRFYKRELRTSSEFSLDEIQHAKRLVIMVTQKYYFENEYKLLQTSTRLPPSSSLLTLNPFIDSSGLIRANGRLVQSPALTYNERHPILLPYVSKLSQLLVEFTHKITLHGGNQLMTRVLRSEFWIFKLKVLVKKTIHNCKICTLYKKHSQNQIMASLPPERTSLTRPFYNTGVDFAGPFNIKNFTGRACLITKGYVCVFICFATKAIHLEATSDLSAQSFLAAFARFIGRRGCPACVYSDNGTNFVGAAELFKKDRAEFMKNLRSQAIIQNSHQSLEWKFIPPGAPHMGGLWEAGVKSFKTHLRKSFPSINFTFEEFTTILIRIEACLNSRPLSPANDDPNDIAPLTPAHFLIGAPMLEPAEPDISDSDISFANHGKMNFIEDTNGNIKKIT